MAQEDLGRSYVGNVAENYEKYFVTSIGEPVARDLITSAALRPGERVLDVACGTGIAARLAAERVGPTGKVAGLDANPAMLSVARASTPSGTHIDWYESRAEKMPLEDETFDVALCQMGLQFMDDRQAATREMHRVLAPGGRVVINVPGPTPPELHVLADALARHAGREAAGFVHAVFSLYEPAQLRELLRAAGFEEIAVDTSDKRLQLPAPVDFLWQYVHSTPLATAFATADEGTRARLEQDVRGAWQGSRSNGHMEMTVSMTTAIARRQRRT